MNPLRKYLMNSTVCYAPSDTATTGGDGTDTSTTDDNKDKDKNNQDDKFDFSKSIWQDDDDKDDKKKDDKDDKIADIDPDKDKKASDFVQRHVDKLNLRNNIDFDAMLTDDGLSVDALKKGFSQLAQNIYISAMRDANKVATGKIDAAVERAVQKSTSEINTTSAYRRMEEKLPSTKNPNIAPFAQQALNKFMSKGQTLEEGIENVRKFLKSTADEVTNNRAADDPPPRRPGSGQFESQSDAPPPVEDWEEYLAQ